MGHQIAKCQDFKGLGTTQAADLTQYVHFRAPTSIACLRTLARTSAQMHAQVLDPITADLPSGCWASRPSRCATMVTIQSLVWQGYVAFHACGTTRYGGAYFGHGQKC